MPERLKRLSSAQRIHLKLLVQWCSSVRVLGVDDWAGLVVERTDARGTETYAIRGLGMGRPPRQPVRPLTAEDIEYLPGDQFALIVGLIDLDAIYPEEGQ